MFIPMAHIGYSQFHFTVNTELPKYVLFTEQGFRQDCGEGEEEETVGEQQTENRDSWHCLRRHCGHYSGGSSDQH